MRTKRPARAVSDFRYSPLFAALSLAFGATEAGAANAFLVTVPGDRPALSPTVPGTLRDAIEFFNDSENCTGSGDIIAFDPVAFSNNAFIVGVSEALPIIHCDGLTIDGAGTFPDRATLKSSGGIIDYGLKAETATGHQVTVQNMNVSAFSYGTALLGNFSADNNRVSGNVDGIDLQQYSGTSANPLTVSRNDVSANTGIGIRVDGHPLRPLIQNVKIGHSSGGNQVHGNATGIYISYGGSTVTVEGNSITGNVHLPSNDGIGIYLESSQASVNDNLISGNNYAIYVEADQGSTITSNRIGSSNDGLAAFANNHGIVFGASSSELSQDTQISGNVISGNGGVGIDLSNFTDVRIIGNKIGTGIDGIVPMGNSNGGILAFCGSGIEISGGNVISNNGGSGIEFGAVQGGGALNIVGNKIGVKGNGTTALGNSAYGVALALGSCGFTGNHDLLIRDNIIANNSFDGVFVGFNSTGNQIVANNIYGNFGKNIDLDSGGPRANDSGDADTGPNNGQNFPAITSVARDWPNGRTVVDFTLDTAPGLYRIDAYSNNIDASPGGLIKHGFMSFNKGAGPASGTFMVSGLAVGNEPNHFSLTATGPFGSAADMENDAFRRDTSEFSWPTAFIEATVDVTITPNPPDLLFGQVSIDTVSPPRSITLRSSGTEPYQIHQMRLDNCSGPLIYGGPFMISSTCSTHVDYPPTPVQSCQITAQFAPIDLTTSTTTIALCDNSNFEGTRLFTLTGTGVLPPPVQIVPSEFDFGSVLAGSNSPPQEFRVYNTATSAVSIGPITVNSADFVITSNTCGATVPAASSCGLQVFFAPSQPQSADAMLTVNSTTTAVPESDAIGKRLKVTGGSASAHLKGQGIQVADIRLPSFIDFGAYALNTPPLRQVVEITNSGNAVVSLNSVSVAGPFVLVSGCPSNLAPGERCTLVLEFSTTTLGEFSGTLSVVSNATGGTRTIPLAAHSIPVPAPQLSLSPVTINFGDRLLGTTSPSQRVTIRNIGSAPAVISSITSSADFVVLGNTCTTALAPTSTCFADVALRPVGFGVRTGSLFVNSNATGSPNVVNLGGAGCRPFSSSSSRFGVGTGFNCAP